jgi:hypothetical protein
LTQLEVRVALAAISRWDDLGAERAPSLIPHLVREGLKSRSIHPAAAAAFLCLGVDIKGGVLNPIVEHLRATEFAAQRSLVTEELTRLTLLSLDGEEGVSEVRTVMELVTPTPSTPWVVQGQATLKFFEEQGGSKADERTIPSPREMTDSAGSWRAAIANGSRFGSREEIEATLTRVTDDARRASRYVAASEVLEEIRRVVPPMDRRTHIEALAQCALDRGQDQVTSGIAVAVTAWASSSPSVASWCAEQLPQLIVERLPAFFRSTLNWESSVLPSLFKESRLSNDQICEALLEGLEVHANQLSASSVYGILGVVANHLPSGEAADVLERHLTQEVKFLTHGQMPFQANDIPSTVDEAIGRMFYALLGDREPSRALGCRTRRSGRCATRSERHR